MWWSVIAKLIYCNCLFVTFTLEIDDDSFIFKSVVSILNYSSSVVGVGEKCRRAVLF